MRGADRHRHPEPQGDHIFGVVQEARGAQPRERRRGRDERDGRGARSLGQERVKLAEEALGPARTVEVADRDHDQCDSQRAAPTAVVKPVRIPVSAQAARCLQCNNYSSFETTTSAASCGVRPVVGK